MTKAEEKNKNYEFYIHADLSEYEGKWIAIVDGRVVASGDDPEEVYKKAEKNTGKTDVSLAYVPENELLIL